MVENFSIIAEHARWVSDNNESSSPMRSDRTIQAVLASLVVFDAVLVIWAFGFPDLWFTIFHTSAEATPGAELFLRRCGGNWAAFLLFQALALSLWKQHTFWLAVVAGLRLGDIFTDPVYVLTADDPSLLAWVSLPVAGVSNLVLGWYFLTSYLERREPADRGGGVH